MCARKREQNEQIRETRRLQILDAALTVYVNRGYNGTDVDEVAKHAGLAKGLIYYYFKTKRELFTAMFEWMMDKTKDISRNLVLDNLSARPIERLVKYTWDIFKLAQDDPRVIQFTMRLPFDSPSIFVNNEWNDGFESTTEHHEMLTSIIQEGIDLGEIPKVNAAWAANCFWTVYISNLFTFPKMIGNVDAAELNSNPNKLLETVREILTFCFQGLGLSYETWGKYLEQIILK